MGSTTGSRTAGGSPDGDGGEQPYCLTASARQAKARMQLYLALMKNNVGRRGCGVSRAGGLVVEELFVAQGD